MSLCDSETDLLEFLFGTITADLGSINPRKLSLDQIPAEHNRALKTKGIRQAAQED